jgi:hypothetical protein
MLLIVLTIIFAILAVVAGKILPTFEHVRYDDDDNKIKTEIKWIPRTVRGVFVFLAIVCFAATSIFIIDAGKSGHLKRIYLADDLPSGRIIAIPGQKGLQAELLTPGFKFIPFGKVLYDIEEYPDVTVEQGQYAILTAKDGKPMPEGEYLAPAWEKADDMINSLKFMGYTEKSKDYEGPRGVKGPQLTVLPPGTYRINRYLFEIQVGESTDIPTGFVGVVKSNVGEHYKGERILPSNVKETELSVPIVPKGHRGVWKDVLTPGRYYINQIAYDVIKIPTRVQTWKYIGGYDRRVIDLEISDDGKIKQVERKETIPFDPEVHADRAIVLRVEGWEVPQDARVQVQVTPENAPFVVAAVGDLQQVEDKIITPNFRSIMRNRIARTVTIEEPILDDNGLPKKDMDGNVTMRTVTRPRKVLDLLYNRDKLEEEVAEDLVPEGEKAGLTVQWVRFGDPAVPPELLIPQKRTQLAKQLEATYDQERKSQVARVNTEKERARADQQADLMKSEIGKQVASNEAEQKRLRGQGEEDYMKALARGQEAQANVLGKDKAFELAYLKEVMAAVKETPEMVKYPSTFVMGEGSGLSGAAAILGANNVGLGLQKRNSANITPEK